MTSDRNKAPAKDNDRWIPSEPRGHMRGNICQECVKVAGGWSSVEGFKPPGYSSGDQVRVIARFMDPQNSNLL